MTAGDAGEAFERAPNRTVLLDSLAKVGAACRRVPAVAAKQRTERELVDDHEPHEQGGCHVIAAATDGEPRSRHRVHGVRPRRRGDF